MTKPRYIERSFPIVQINPLAQREASSLPPLYKMHKWYARRSTSVFRAILLGSALPYEDADGQHVDLMHEFYQGHGDDQRLRRSDGTPLRVLDPFMGGGTSVVEALRLGFDVTGIDINPIAWFIVKGETTPVDVDELQAAYKRVAAEVKEEILDLYRTECPITGESADIIYGFWVKQGICTDPTCKHVTDLFKSYEVARKRGDATLRYIPLDCPSCAEGIDWELDRASITAGQPQVWGINAEGKGRPEGRPCAFGLAEDGVACPNCGTHIGLGSLPRKPKPKKKKVGLHVLLDPETYEFFEVRGGIPERVTAPSGLEYDPRNGPATGGKFVCAECGKKQAIVDSARANAAPLPFRHYGVFAHSAHLSRNEETRKAASALGLPTYSGKWFKSVSLDMSCVDTDHGVDLSVTLGPTQGMYDGYNTNRLLIHQYRNWSSLFLPRQRLCLARILHSIESQAKGGVRLLLLAAFQSAIDNMSVTAGYQPSLNKMRNATAGHDFRNPTTIAENNPWGTGGHGQGTFSNCVEKVVAGLRWRTKPSLPLDGERSGMFVEVEDLPPANWSPLLLCRSSTHLPQVSSRSVDIVATDPPYADSVQYAEMADFPYVWLHQVLKDVYPEFEPELILKSQEIIENGKDKDADWFFEKLTLAWKECHRVLVDDGLLVFTFHHKEGSRWTGLLRSIFDAGFYLVAAYPTHSEALNSIVIQATKGITYDIIHVCRKRVDEPEPIPWALLRRDVQREARTTLAELEASGDVLPGPDVWMILLGSALRLFSQHYGRVLDHDGAPIDLDEAMARIRVLVREVRGESLPLPGALEGADGLSIVYLLHIVGHEAGWTRDGLHIELRGYGHGPDDLLEAGMIEVDPGDKHRWLPTPALTRAAQLGDGIRPGQLVDSLHQLLGIAARGGDLEAHIRLLRSWPRLVEGLRYLGKRDRAVQETADLVIRAIEALGPEPEGGAGQQELLFSR